MNRQIITAALLTLIMAGVLFANAVYAADDSLAKAYKKEFAFLEAEKKSLEKLIANQDAITEKSILEAKQELGSLQAKLLWAASEATRLEELLMDSEREAEALIENVDTLDGTVSQAAQTLDRYDVKLPEAGDDETSEALQKRLSFLYNKSLSTLDILGSVVAKSGEFFLKNGSVTQGEIIRLGNVAAMGVSDKGAGALAPAGDGRFKIWDADAKSVAKSLAKGDSPKTLKMFIFESLDKAIDQRESKSAVDIINQGGVIGWVIVLLGIGAIAMIAMRSKFLYGAASRRDAIIQEVSPLIEAGKINEAEKVCKASKGATARVLKATIRNLDRDREHLEDIISESILHETPFLDRFGSSILVFAAVAPLLGLLGTVTGMISTFDVITEFGTGDPKLLSGGISEALVTTELGLIVAIPTLLLGNLLSGWAEKIKTSMENAALTITNLSFSKRQGDLFDKESQA